ncbi:MAG: response regulator receiver [Candidatus Saganbacteria bacterium]|uniref:Response regulator receiver n=1 Tax=Candidatus Saganbacteria bacterium TaxID=2575572 RepID=A0A833P2Y5_UNCSA|nr:MAG: response regulator receiver [Candidatus Saganbacteria bacterium]
MEKPLILVVEDEPMMAENIAEIIRATGRYEAVVALSTREGFEQLDKHKRFLGLADNQIKCIVLDIKMPGMDGLEFLKWIRRQESFMKLIPVIILSGYEDKEKWTRATAMGKSAAYLKKPLNEEELTDTIDRVFAGDWAYMMDQTYKKGEIKCEELKE